MKNSDKYYAIGFLLMTLSVFGFIMIEGVIMMKTPTNPDNVKIREATIHIVEVLAGGLLVILTNQLSKNKDRNNEP